MSERLKDRGRLSEEEYFRKKNHEAIERLREKMRVAHRQKKQVSRRCVVPVVPAGLQRLSSRPC